MKLNLVSFRMTVAYGTMIMFIGIPIVKTLLNSPFSVIELYISYGVAVSFGLYATHELEKYDSIKKAENIFKKHKQDFQSDCKDRTLKEKCPECGSELQEISKTDPTKKMFGTYKALIFCTVCDFEEPKEDYDRRLCNGKK